MFIVYNTQFKKQMGAGADYKFYVPRKNVIFLSSVRWQQGAAHAQIAKGSEKKPYMDFE
jgi:hypothetical protein